MVPKLQKASNIYAIGKTPATAFLVARRSIQERSTNL